MEIQNIRYLGHSAILLEGKDKIIAIDPWLSNPKCPQEYRELTKLDLIILTHGHSDHAGDAVALAKHHNCEVLATYELAMIIGSEGVNSEKLIPMNKGGTLLWNSLQISLVHAQHSNSYDSSHGTIYAGEACGVVIQDRNNSIYHAGDTELFSDMKLIKELYSPNIALLPIGDRFTMGPTAAAHAANLINPVKLIPIHHSTFPPLTGTVAELREKMLLSDTEIVDLKPGEALEIS